MSSSGQKRSATDSSRVDTNSNTSPNEDTTAMVTVIDDDGKDRTGRNVHGYDGGQNQDGPVSHNSEKESHRMSNHDSDMSQRQDGKLIVAVPDVLAEGESFHQNPPSSSSSKRRRVSSDNSAQTSMDGDSIVFTKDTNAVESRRGQRMVTTTTKDVITNGLSDRTPAAAAATVVPAAKLDQMPSKALETILEFLDVSPREMFVLVTSIKPFYDSIQSRPDIVVKNAFLAGENYQKIVSEIVTYIKNESIHIPKTNRLLRLINGERCERGEECFGYNLITGRSAILDKKEQSKRPCGLCLCDHCVKVMFVSQCKLVPYYSCIIPEEFESEGIIMNPGATWYNHVMLRDPVREKCTGSDVGSLLTSMHLSQMMVLGHPPSRWHSGFPESNITKQNEYRTKMSKKIRPLLDSIVEESNSYDQHASEIILSAHKNAKEERRLRQQKLLEAQQKRRVAQEQRRMNVLEDIMNTLNELGKEYNWLFECRICSSPSETSFSVKFVDDILGPFVRAPSKITKRKRASAIMDMVETIEKLENAGLLPLPGQILCSTTDLHNQYERSLTKYYRENYKSLFFRKSYWEPSLANAKFVRLAVSGAVVEALEHVVDFNDFFASAMSSRYAEVYPNATIEAKYNIAFGICCNYRREQHSNFSNFDHLRLKYMKFLDGLEQFRKSSFAKDYMEGRLESLPTTSEYPRLLCNRRKVIYSIFTVAGSARFDKFRRINDVIISGSRLELLVLLIRWYNYD